jgi:hypothetical protein
LIGRRRRNEEKAAAMLRLFLRPVGDRVPARSYAPTVQLSMTLIRKWW